MRILLEGWLSPIWDETNVLERNKIMWKAFQPLLVGLGVGIGAFFTAIVAAIVALLFIILIIGGATNVWLWPLLWIVPTLIAIIWVIRGIAKNFDKADYDAIEGFFRFLWNLFLPIASIGFFYILYNMEPQFSKLFLSNSTGLDWTLKLGPDLPRAVLFGVPTFFVTSFLIVKFFTNENMGKIAAFVLTGAFSLWLYFNWSEPLVYLTPVIEAAKYLRGVGKVFPERMMFTSFFVACLPMLLLIRAGTDGTWKKVFSVLFVLALVVFWVSMCQGLLETPNSWPHEVIQFLIREKRLY